MIFDRLDREELKSIIDIQLKRVVKRLLKQGITIEFSDEARGFIVEEGYDPAYGVRPLKRAIQKHLSDPLSLAILDVIFAEGDRIIAELDAGEIVFVKV